MIPVSARVPFSVGGPAPDLFSFASSGFGVYLPESRPLRPFFSARFCSRKREPTVRSFLFRTLHQGGFVGAQAGRMSRHASQGMV